MIGWAATFLIIALVAAVLGFAGVAGVATNIAWVLFLIGLVLALVFAFAGRRRPRSRGTYAVRECPFTGLQNKGGFDLEDAA